MVVLNIKVTSGMERCVESKMVVRMKESSGWGGL